MRRIGIVCAFCLVVISFDGYAQGGDLIGFKGGYKALSRLFAQNLDNAGRLLVNDYSRGYFVSVSIHPGTDSVSDISFLTATPPAMAREIAWALRGTNGQWIRKDQARTILIPIFFCQNTPPNDSLFSQLLITNNVGFTVDQFPDQWPEAVSGVWIHPICPLVTGGTPRQPLAPATAAQPSAATTTPMTAAPATNAAATVPAAAGATAPVTVTPTASAPPAPVPSTPATTTVAAPATPPQAPPGYVLTRVAAPAGPDTVSISGIYRTKDQFDNNDVSFGSSNSVEQKGLLSWFNIEYVAYGPVRIKDANREPQEFSVGSIYGFKSNNISYVYVKSLKEYMAILRKSPAFFLVMDERRQTGYNGATNVDGIFMYAKTLDGPVKEFTKHNIENDFGSNVTFAADLQVLRKELNKHSVTMSRGDFEACRELANDYLSKWDSAK